MHEPHEGSAKRAAALAPPYLGGADQHICLNKIAVVRFHPDEPKGADMSDDDNMTMRRFPDQVDVTRPQEIDHAMHDPAHGATAEKAFKAPMVPRIDGQDPGQTAAGTLAGRRE
ncbi:MAG: DUF6494 family protein [Pseudomonadota bacterium]